MFVGLSLAALSLSRVRICPDTRIHRALSRELLASRSRNGASRRIGSSAGLHCRAGSKHGSPQCKTNPAELGTLCSTLKGGTKGREQEDRGFSSWREF